MVEQGKQELIKFDPANITVFNEFEGALAELEKDAARTKHDFDDPQGLIEAKRDVKKATTSITAIEKIRKQEKKESLDYGRALDKKAKDITARLEAVREINAGPIREIKEQEEARLRCHNDNLNAFFAFRDYGPEYSSGDYENELEAIEKMAIDDSWDEFKGKAMVAKDQAVNQIKEIIESKQKLEQEQAELEKLREEKAAREKADHEAAIAAEAEAKAKKEAEELAERVKQDNIRKERESKEAQEKQQKLLEEARERKENEDKLALETAKREKAEAEQRTINAEKEAREKLEREQREQQEAEEEETRKREANKKHRAKINNEAKNAIAAKLDSSDDSHVAKSLVEAIARGEIPHVTIGY